MSWPETKYATNSTIGTGYKESLDQLLGAKIVCRGHIGTKFTITRADGYYAEKTAEITENSKANNGVPFETVPVPVGIYNLKVTYKGISTDVTVNASALGATYVPAYDLTVVLAEYTSPGTYTFTKPPDLLSDTVSITACGGGAGGNAGTYTSGYGDGGNGGAGGGGASAINKKTFSIANITSLSITVGKGGEATRSGTATIIGSLVTLAGGAVGGGFSGGAGGQATNGSQSNARVGGNGGGTNGGKGGGIRYMNDNSYWYSGGGGGGQGGNSVYPGGSGGGGSDGGGNSGGSGGSGSRGSGGGGGGGGGRYAGKGGSGGDGYVKIEMILKVG